MKLPKESKSQKLGHIAKQVFEANRPSNWRTTHTDDDADVGLDVQVQIVTEGAYQYPFHVQIKGSRETKNGKNKWLNEKEKYYSVPLGIKTLNYYLRIANPKMVVFADLTLDALPKNCKIYYLWIDDELKKISKGKDNLDHLKKKQHTFHIPISNELNESVDILPYLNKRYSEKHALDNLFDTIAKQSTSPTEIIKNLGNKFSSKPYFESVISKADTPWPNPPMGSFAFGLNQVSEHLKMNHTKLAKLEIDKLEIKINTASSHEKSEFYFQKAVLYALLGKHKVSLENHENAFKLSPNISKYRIGLIEEQLYNKYRDSDFCEKIIKQIDNESDVSYLRIKIKLLASIGKIKEALSLLPKFKVRERAVLLALILFINRDYKDCIEKCDIAFVINNITLRQKLTLHILKARSFFSIGMSKDYNELENFIIPFSGLPEMQSGILINAWNELKEGWSIAEKLNYPLNVEFLMDISAILGTYFNEIDYFYKHLKIISNDRPFNIPIQKTLLILAQQLNDNFIVENQLKILPASSEIIVHQIIFYYNNSEKTKVVDLLISNLELLIKDNPINLDIALLMAAECAHDLFRQSDKTKIIVHIKQISNSDSILALLSFVTSVKDNILDRQKAIDELFKVYKSGCKDRRLVDNLFQYIDINDKLSASRIIEISNTISEYRSFSEKEYEKISRAKIKLQDWSSALDTINEAIERFRSKIKLLSIKALVLDEIGNTPQAINILEGIANENKYDYSALNLYAQISARCGLIDSALNNFKKLYEKSKNDNEKKYYLRALFSLELLKNPKSDKLLSICEKYGSINNKEDEAEEGIYLQLFYFSTLNERIIISDKQRINFQRRFKNYIEKFPESSYLRAIQVSKDASGEELIKVIENVIGFDDDRKRWFKNNEELLDRGLLPLPFSIRAKVLFNVQDIFYLWEMTKKYGYKFGRFQLTISRNVYEQRNLQVVANKIPLIDEVALLILFDLDVLNYIFKVFPKIAILKSTLVRLQNASYFSLTSNKVREIIRILSTHVHQIIQPSSKPSEIIEFNFDALDEYKEIMNDRNFVFYTDDAITRLYVCGADHAAFTISTYDIINMLVKHKHISQKYCIQKLAQMCEWYIQGLKIYYLDILRILVDDFNGKEDIKECIRIINENRPCISLINYIWTIDKDIKKLTEEIGDFVTLMITTKDLIVINNIVIAIWYKWYQKIQFHKDRIRDKIKFLSSSFILISIKCTRKLKENEYKQYSEKLWSLFKDLICYIYGNQMSESIDKKSINVVAEQAVQIDNDFIRDDVCKFIINGLHEESKDRELFNTVYVRERVKSESKK